MEHHADLILESILISWDLSSVSKRRGAGTSKRGSSWLGYSEERNLYGSHSPLNMYLLYAYYWPGTKSLASVKATTELIFS